MSGICPQCDGSGDEGTVFAAKRCGRCHGSGQSGPTPEEVIRDLRAEVERLKRRLAAEEEEHGATLANRAALEAEVERLKAERESLRERLLKRLNEASGLLDGHDVNELLGEAP